MSERDNYEHGVPCFVSGVFPDPDAAASFYSELMGWETENLMPPEHPGDYLVCRLRDRDVAAIVSQHVAPTPPQSVWTTLFSVESVDEAASRAASAGGSDRRALRLARWRPPGDPGRPAGAVFSVWEPRERHGAQLVNEPSAWSMSALNTDDPDAAKRFYTEVFGWDTKSFDMGGAELVMWTVPGYVGARAAGPARRRRGHAAAGRGRRGPSPLERGLLGRERRCSGGQGHRARGQGGGPAL
jgi:predicted enzyme related to lactoylglutathione lyase